MRMIHRRLAATLSLLAAPLPAREPTLEVQVRATLAAAGPGTRFGMVVATAEGEELVAISPDDRFVPASNTKIFTTAAAFAMLPSIDRPDTVGGASVRLAGPPAAPDVILEGHGDARLSSAPDCAVDCLATLADAVAARTRVVHDVVGDDTAFPDERWSPGMSWNNLSTRSGAAVSALTIDDNEIAIHVSPGPAIGAPAVVDGAGPYTIDNRVMTGGTTELGYDRLPGGDVVRLTGTIASGAAPEILRIALDDPARQAALRLRTMLVARSIRVTGAVTVRHRPPLPGDDTALRNGPPSVPPPSTPPLAQLTPPPLLDDLRVTSKSSQNVHAELLLRRLGAIAGTGSIADGRAVVRAVLDRAGLPRWCYDLADGSGMSSYNRVTPRAMVRFLRWTAMQPWGAAWRATLPVGGVDGTLTRRFRGTPLEGRVQAKTGSLNAANALAGFLTTADGRTLTFAVYAADMPGDASATATIDRALGVVATAPIGTTPPPRN